MDKIVLAYDKSTLTGEDLRTLEQIVPHVGFVKVGYQAMFSRTREGETVADAVADFIGDRSKMIYDAKLHDIGNTMAEAVRALCGRCGGFTFHAGTRYGSVEAVAAALREWRSAHPGQNAPVPFGVTVLTDFDADECEFMYGTDDILAIVKKCLSLLNEHGIGGVVCSAKELEFFHSTPYARHMRTLVPGIRPAWAEANDQKRVMTPGEAAKLGADYLVIGRPIWKGPYPPLEAVKRINDEIAEALA